MTVVGYAAGWMVLLAITAPAAWAAVESQRLLLPRWTASWAALVWIVGTSSLVLLDAELLGTFGLLRPWPLAISSPLLWGGLAVALRRRPRPRTTSQNVTVPADKPALVLAAVAVIAVLSQWTAWTLAALRRGITGVDALLYHSTFAARFAQTGYITRLQQAVPGEPMAFYPANAEVAHAVGMVAFRRDIVSPFVNLSALGVVLLAAWALGRRWGGAPAAVAGIALLAAIPYFAYSAAGTTFNDTPALAAWLCSVVLVTRTPEEPRATFFAALAAGLAVGTKLSFLAPAVFVALAGVWMAQGRRAVTALVWVAAMAATGGYWFVRNLVRAGNPVPGLGLGLGFPSPTFPVVQHFGARLWPSVRLSRWGSVYHTGLRDYFGRPWAFVVLAIAAGLLLALWSRGPSRVIGLVAISSLVAYGFTPISGDSLFFRVNLRYALGLQALALLLLATTRRLAVPWGQRPLVVGALVAGAATFPGPAVTADIYRLPAWPPGDGHRLGAVLVVVGLVGVVAVLLFGARIDRRVGLAGIALGAGLVVAGLPVTHRFEASRYQALPGGLGPAFRWAQGVRRARIGVVGVYLQYPFTGPDLSNTVQYVGVDTPHHGFADAATCRTWRNAVNRGRYEYVVTADQGYLAPPGEPPAAAWTRKDPAASEILHSGNTAIFRVLGRLHPAAC